ncbi:MAG TPA: hypothetical protein VIP46_10765 [Pyrinomonadaceae bacterium]
MRSGHLFRALLVVLTLAASAGGAGIPALDPDGEERPPEWSLDQIKDKRRVFLLATRSRVLDVRGPDPEALLKAAGDGKVRTHNYPYIVIARKLNEYIRKRKGLTAVDRASEADFVIYFNVLEYRRTLNGVYPYGELFVILNGDAGGRSQPPRIIWRTRKASWAEDAAKEFIKELKRVRGEK